MNRHVQWMREAYGIPDAERHPGLNATLLLSEQREFADSASSPGLQFADMLAAILRRALNYRLQSPGWAHFGRLVISDNSTPFLIGQVEKVWRARKTGNKQMRVRKKTNLRPTLEQVEKKAAKKFRVQNGCDGGISRPTGTAVPFGANWNCFAACSTRISPVWRSHPCVRSVAATRRPSKYAMIGKMSTDSDLKIEIG